MKKFTTILVALVVAFTLSGCEQAVVDAQMEVLCKQDGGMKIYEKVVLPKDQFTKYGSAPFFFEGWGKSGGLYQFVDEFEQIRPNKPSLSKFKFIVIRKTDNKILGTYVHYQRIGGDVLPRLGPDSSSNCPPKTDSDVFLKNIFVSAN